VVLKLKKDALQVDALRPVKTDMLCKAGCSLNNEIMGFVVIVFNMMTAP
jgi:hypothetical protein